MPRFSTYSADYTNLQTMPWDFWTDEERSYVLKQAYDRLYLTSQQIQPYLKSSINHYYTQWLVPIALAGLYQFNLKTTLFGHFYRKSPLQGNIVGGLFLAASTVLWLNFSPFYIHKEQQQVQALNLLYNKVGTGMKILNGYLPRIATSTSIDKDTFELYTQRNSSLTGIRYAEEDTIPAILPKNAASKNFKKIYL